MKRRPAKPRMSIADVLATKHAPIPVWEPPKPRERNIERDEVGDEFRTEQMARLDKAKPFIDELWRTEKAAGAAQGWPPSVVLMTGFFMFLTMDARRSSDHPFIMAGGYLHRHLEKARAHHRAGMYADPFREVVRP